MPSSSSNPNPSPLEAREACKKSSAAPVADASAQAEADVRRLLRAIAQDWPNTANWAADPERIASWTDTLLRSGLTLTDLQNAYRQRDLTLEHPPSLRELVRLAVPDDAAVEASFMKAIGVSYNDQYHRLSPQEWWAFQHIDRVELRTSSKTRLLKRWRALLMDAAHLPDLPLPPAAPPSEARLAAPSTRISQDDIRQTIHEAFRLQDEFLNWVRTQPIFGAVQRVIVNEESAANSRLVFQLAREYLQQRTSCAA